MTNTTYFHTVFRDDESVSSDQISEQLDSLPRETQRPSSSLYSAISKTITAWINSPRPARIERTAPEPQISPGPTRNQIQQRPGSPRTEDSSNDEKDYLSSGNISSKFVFPSCGEGGKLERSNSKSFSFQVLEAATSSFHHELGEGCFGKVFKGWIDGETTCTNPSDSIAVAVKRLDHRGAGGNQDWNVHDSRFHVEYDHGGYTEWAREVEYLGRLYHPNLVRLCGHCSGGEERLLVYEFMSRGSLDNHLFKRSSSCLLSWTLRMKIALGAAKGLAFLHSNEVNVIHRGFKSSDILLDSDYNAKLSDFGLAMDGSAGDIPTGVFGTPGYVAPEYIATGRLSTKSDVYSFGVVLLEILSGRRIIEYRMHSCQYNLVHWADLSLSHEEKVFCVLDRSLEGQYSMESAQIAVKLALLCVAMEAKARPNMDEVVTILEGLQDLPNPSDQEETLEL